MTTPLGGDVPATWQALLEGRSGVRALPEAEYGQLPVRIAAAVVLAVGVFWAAHATGNAAASVRRVLRTYISLDSISS